MVLFFFALICFCIVLVPHIIYAIMKLLSLVCHFHVTYHHYGYTALGMLIAWLILFGWGHWFGRYFYEVKEVSIACKNLPKSFEGMKVVHISDLHLDGWEGHEEKLQEIIDSINSLDADVIFFTGDLVSLSKDELKPFTKQLSQLKAKEGVYSIMGNHDYLPYNKKMSDRDRDAMVKAVEQMERDMGWHLLLNEHAFIHRGNDSIAVIGCENQDSGMHIVIRRGDLKKAMAGTEGTYPIILTHNPNHWEDEIIPNKAFKDGALTLSGHTHSGQFRVLGFSAASFIYKEYDGLYTKGDHNLYVNIGLGGTMPMRIGATPEVTLITLSTK